MENSGRLRQGKIEKKRRCVKCNIEVLAMLVRIISQSGISQVYWKCPLCNYGTDGSAMYIKHEILRQYVVIETIPIDRDYSKVARCEVFGCQNIGAEFHHWAPHHLFEDADSWPTSYLCKTHHALWHKTLTPNMCNRKDK